MGFRKTKFLTEKLQPEPDIFHTYIILTFFNVTC